MSGLACGARGRRRVAERMRTCMQAGRKDVAPGSLLNHCCTMHGMSQQQGREKQGSPAIMHGASALSRTCKQAYAPCID